MIEQIADELEAIEARGAAFDEEGKFRAPLLAEWLRQQFPTAIGGRRLYAFRDGGYEPAEDFLRHRTGTILAAQWTVRRATEVITYLQHTSPELKEMPPRDRIAVANGVLALSNRKLTEPSPAFLSPVRLAAAYDPDATCPAIEWFLSDVFPGGANLIHELIGTLMIPEQRQKAIMILGPGGNGKTTALRIIKSFLGARNVSNISLHALDENRFAAADLYGKLANIYADIDARALSSTGIFKSITGGDPIRAEHKHQAAFTFQPYAKLIFSANEPPPTSDASEAFFDRWLIIPFEKRFRGTKQEHQQDELLAELTTTRELSGLLNHALDGLERVRHAGHYTTTTTTTHQAGEQFRQAVDTVAGFLADKCEIDPDGTERRATLWSSYQDWCKDNNRRPLGSQRFHGRLRTLAHPDEKTVNGWETYDGIRLKDSQ